MYLKSIRVQNFRCLGDVSIDFEPLTALVGPNGSGKTAILDALGRGTQLSNFRNHDPQNEPGFSGVLGTGKHFGPDNPGPPCQLVVLHLSPAALRLGNSVQAQNYLQPDGSNLANVFATLSRKTQGQVAQHLCELVPVFQDVDVRPGPQPGHHRIIFRDRWDGNLLFEPGEVSDGTFVLLALLTLAHLEAAPQLLAIEEPEHTLHPFLLGEVVKMLRSLAAGGLGPEAVQVILATHSAELLDFLEPREVRFVTRSLDDGSTRVKAAPVDTDQWKAAYDEYDASLGNMWLSGGLGGVPGTPAA